MTKKTIVELTAKAKAEEEIIVLHTAEIKRDGLRLNQTEIQALESLLDHCFGDECDDFEGELDDIDALYVRGKDGQYPEVKPRRSPRMTHLCSDRVTHQKRRTLIRKPQVGKALSSPPKAGRWVRFREQTRVISRECRRRLRGRNSKRTISFWRS